MNDRLKFAATSTSLEGSLELARKLGGTLFCDERESFSHLPFRALTTVVTDDLEALSEVADVGLYVVFQRVIKPGPASMTGLFPLLRRPDLSHRQADDHWRDQHGPLALVHHAHMTHYSQLAVLHCISGPELDGFALCGFKDIDDLRQRFYSEPDGPQVIAEDVARFADTRNSPRRLIAAETRFHDA